MNIEERNGRWRVRIRPAGKKHLSRTFGTHAEAVKWGRAIEHRLDRGERLGGSKKSVADLLQHYEQQRAESGRAIRRQSNEHYMLKRLTNWFTGPYEKLGTQAILDYARARKRAGAGPYTINMELSKLGTALRYSCSLLEIQYHDPVATARPALHHLGLIGAGNKRDRRPSADEWAKLFVEFKKLTTEIPMADIVQFAALTGMRRSEVCRVRWSDLDQERRVLLIRDCKHPRKRVGNDEFVPLVFNTLDIVMRQPRREARIFPYNPGTVSHYFKVARRAGGIDDLVLHDMRHEATSALFEAGWQIPEVAAVTRHKDWRHLKRYTNLDPALVAKKPRS